MLVPEWEVEAREAEAARAHPRIRPRAKSGCGAEEAASRASPSWLRSGPVRHLPTLLRVLRGVVRGLVPAGMELHQPPQPLPPSSGPGTLSKRPGALVRNGLLSEPPHPPENSLF